MTSENAINSCKSKMKKAFDVFKTELSSLRTGRANIAMLDIIKVEVYGQKMSINQLATISTPEARLITVQVWDQNNVSLIDSAIKAKVSIRNIRREANDSLKKDLKDKKLGEDEYKNSEKKIQNLTDAQISELEKKLEEKEKEIMTV